MELFQIIHAVVCDIAHVYMKMPCNVRNIESTGFFNKKQTTIRREKSAIRLSESGLNRYDTFYLLKK
jgi:hypothetical protein